MSAKTLIGVFLGSAIGFAAMAADYPERPIQLIVPYNAGGAVDFVGRVVAQHVSDRVGQQVVVENRAGASGNIGSHSVATATADGYTLLMSAVTSSAINLMMQSADAGFSLQDDFTPVASVGMVPLVLVVHPSVPGETVEEFIANALGQTSPVTFASSGVGSTEHLGAELFRMLTDIPMLHVPYTGGAPAMADVVGGHVQAMVATVPTAIAHIEAGTVRPLVLATSEGLEQLPNVPSAVDSGMAEFQVSSMYAVLAPAETDGVIVARLNAAIAESTATEAFRQSMAERGIVPLSTSEEEARTLFNAEFEKWSRVIRDAGIAAQ